MASEDFARDLRVTAPPERCWAVLTDVGTLASWVTVLHDVEEISRLDRYSVVLASRLGPMKLTAKLDVRVDVLGERRGVRIRAAGRDGQVDSAISVDATLRLEPGEATTTVAVSGSYSVTGRVASMGGGIIRKKAEVLLEEFFTGVGRALGADAVGAAAGGQDARDAGVKQ